MREIKFRGQINNVITDNEGNVIKEFKSLVYGDLLHRPNGVLHLLTLKDEGFYENHAIDPDTISQFTGLKDKSGKEIYEGDIISVNGKYPKLIRYIDEWASYCLANLTDLDCDLKTRYWQQVSPCWWTDYKREIKVIGNVYDNPELLKGGSNEE